MRSSDFTGRYCLPQGWRHLSGNPYTFAGYLLEILILDNILSSTQINSVTNSYLKVKYGIPSSSKTSLNQSASQLPASLKVNGVTVPISSLSSSSISANLQSPITYPAFIEFTDINGKVVSYTIQSLPFQPYKIAHIFRLL